MKFFVCNKCHAGFREDVRESWEQMGTVDAENRCKCGGTFEPSSAEAAVGLGGAIDVAARTRMEADEAVAEALTQLNIAEQAYSMGDEGSARSAVAKAKRILQARLVRSDPGTSRN